MALGRCACCRHAQCPCGRSASICGSAHRQLPFAAGSAPGSPATSPLRGRPRLRRFGFAVPSASCGRLLPPPRSAGRMANARCARQDRAIHRPRQSTSHGRRLARRRDRHHSRPRPAENVASPSASRCRHRSSRTAAIACRQPQDARSAPDNRRNVRTPLLRDYRRRAARAPRGSGLMPDAPTWPSSSSS